MIKKIVLATLFAACLFIFVSKKSGVLFALIPPLSKKELEEESTLIIKGKVKEVKLLSITNDGKWEYKNYRATLKISEVKKGEIKKGESVYVCWTLKKWISEKRRPIGGTFEPSFYPGETVLAYLKEDESEKCFITVSWNGKETLVSAKEEKLPERVGEVIYAK